MIDFREDDPQEARMRAQQRAYEAQFEEARAFEPDDNGDAGLFCTVVGRCYTCRKPFSFHPMLVPSVAADLTTTGEREPICKGCMTQLNAWRVEKGLDPFPIDPRAYDVAHIGELPL